MTDEQTRIEPPPQPKGPRACSWCGKPATTSIMIRPPLFHTVKGRREQFKPAAWANACAQHKVFAYDPLAERVESRAERDRLKAAKNAQTTLEDFLQE